MKNNFVKPGLLFLSALLILTSCIKDDDMRTLKDEEREIADYLIENNIITQPSWTGLYYMEELEGEGSKAVFNDTVAIEYTASLLDGTEIGSSDVSGQPYKFIVRNDNTISGLHEAVIKMKLGGKATLIIPSALAFGASVNGPVKEYSAILYELELVELHPGIPVEPYSTDDILPIATGSGLIYYPVVKTENDLVKPGQTVRAHYTGYLEDGTIFDSSVKKDQIIEFFPGTDESTLIEGFEEALLLMRVGEKFKLFIPSDLGYGDRDLFPFIEANSDLIFDVELIEAGAF